MPTAEVHLENRLAEALKVRCNVRPKLPQNFEGFAVKFPRVDAALEEVKSVFYSLDGDGDHRISFQELKVGMEELKVQVSEEELRQIFDGANTKHSSSIGFREFLLCLAILFLLESSCCQDSRFGMQRVADAFQIIIDAFIFFDEDRDGRISVEEMTKGFGSHNSRKEGSFLRSLSRRINELDISHNGFCSFVDFVNAFLNWVHANEDELAEENEGIQPETPALDQEEEDDEE